MENHPISSRTLAHHTDDLELLASCLIALLLVVPGLDGSYPSAPGQENVFPHALKNVHSVEDRGHYQASQEFHQAPEYQYTAPAQQQHQHVYHPAQPEQQQHLFQPHQQYLVQSTYNVGSHQEQHPVQQSNVQQSKQRHTAVPYNNQRLHVKVDHHPAASQGLAHPNAPTAQHLRQQLAQEPKKDYRSYIPKSIAPKLNPLHPSFHQKRNFVPLHHITRQVPLPAGKMTQGQHHSHSEQPQPVKAALAAPSPKHISG
ncbi:putative cyclin-dependent serine/threonine-protein kinase DDB_G0272797/DDB_G0274007 isoform X1 [Anopheles stephensi]|uniref:putative cyclin-dependent serine/threonine-protein kinase DDB_G0272797/DDB_G0274007 isoform X1 n=1 Tax=Anopheles stephensi TaxID=30069 RepID=UPI001658B272|nr:putative cyclin-dependent serine/threonine-protein kinase DDB_G0272797/DDB_G0274007 isoform X1 [Anopheles stephensi]